VRQEDEREQRHDGEDARGGPERVPDGNERHREGTARDLPAGPGPGDAGESRALG
jgi:hypothetical protein